MSDEALSRLESDPQPAGRRRGRIHARGDSGNRALSAVPSSEPVHAGGRGDGAFQGPGYPGFRGVEERSETINYSAFLRTLWRRRFLFAFTVLLGTGVAAAIIMRMPAHYVAHAFLAIGDSTTSNRTRSGAEQGAMPSPPPDAGTVQTEVEILKSPQLAAEVIHRLRLRDNLEFNPPASTPQPFAIMTRVTNWLLGPQAPSAPTADAAAQEISRTTNDFLQRLKISVKDTSRVIDVAFEAPNPRLAMQVTNAIVEQYLNKQVELRSQSARRTSVWLQDRISELRAKVEEAEKAVEKFRSEAGLFSTPGGSPLLLKQMTDVSAELANAQTSRAALEARLNQLRASMQPKGRGSPPGDLVDSPFMRTLDGLEAEAEQRLAEAMPTLGDKNPTILGLRERLRHVRASMQAERVRVVASAEHDLKIAQMKEKDLNDRLLRLQDDVARMNRSEITLRGLEREAQADRLVLNNFLARFKATSEESDASSQRPDAQFISPAQLPVSPDRPKKGLLMLIAGMFSMAGAAFVVHLVEKSDRSFRGLDDVEGHLHLPGLGMIPMSRAARLSAPEAARYGSSYREAMKATYARLFWTRKPPQVVVITSAFPGEGKTTLALGLAAMAAQSGRRVLLVDADFWKMGASVALGVRDGVGLAELLEGRATLADAVICDAGSGADIMFPGRFTRASLLAWIGNLPKLLKALRNQYDTVIIDSPPVFSVPEATLLANHGDATVMALRWGRTKRDAAKVALRKLRQSGARVAGCVVTAVHERRHARYGYTEATYFSKDLALYRSPTGAVTAGSEQSGLTRITSGLARACIDLAGNSLLLRGPRLAMAAARRVLAEPNPGTRRRVPEAVDSTILPEPSNAPAPRATGKTVTIRRGSPRQALLVIDLPANRTSPTWWNSPPPMARDRLTETINGVAGLALSAGMTVAYANREPDSITARLLSCMMTSTAGNDAVRPVGIDGASPHTFAKRAGDAFANPELDEFLRSRGIDHVFLAGTDGVTSIAQTARSALDRGYRVTFIRDGIFTAFEGRWKRLLKSFETSAAFAVTSGEFAEFSQRVSEDALPVVAMSR